MKNIFPKTLDHLQAGFTLIELMVSLSLFIIVVVALIGSLYTVNDASHRVQAMRSVMDNLNFATESMSRTIRTGTNIGCNGIPYSPCQFQYHSGGNSLTVDSTLGTPENILYQWQEVNGKGVIQESINHGPLEAITAPEIDIQKFAFYVDGAQASDDKQPSVIITMQGVASIPNGTILPFALQTYLSQRTPEARP